MVYRTFQFSICWPINSICRSAWWCCNLATDKWLHFYGRWTVSVQVFACASCQYVRTLVLERTSHWLSGSSNSGTSFVPHFRQRSPIGTRLFVCRKNHHWFEISAGCVQSRVNWASAMGTASWIDLVVLRCISYLLYSHSDCFYTFGPDSCSSLYYVTQTWLYENTRHVHFSRMNTSWMGCVGLADDTKWVGSGLN